MAVDLEFKDMDCFNVYWKIKNFSYGYEEIQTPEFSFSGSPWCLTLRPKDVEIRLRTFNPEYEHRWMTFQISLLPCDGSPPIHSKKGQGLRVSKDVLFGTRRSSFLPDDTVTFRFRYPTMFEKGKIVVRSEIGVKRYTFMWTLVNFSKIEQRNIFNIEKFVERSKRYGNIALSLKFNGGFIEDEQVYIEIFRKGGDECYCFLKVSVLDINGMAVNEIVDEFPFEKQEETQTRMFPPIIQKGKLLALNNQLLPYDTLSLKCNFAISLGTVTDQTSVISYCNDVAPLLVDDQDFFESSKRPRCLCSRPDLSAALHELLDDGTFSDVELQIGSERILAHKSVLSVRSTFFGEIFTDYETEDNDTVVIEGFDFDTIRRLLIYMYTDKIGNLEFESIMKMYLAADKYQVNGLKEKCSSRLKTNLSVSNACKILVFAEEQKDTDLQTAVLHFLSEHKIEVFASVEWKEFEANHPSKACNTVSHICILGQTI